jgi:hypothetical protein
MLSVTFCAREQRVELLYFPRIIETGWDRTNFACEVGRGFCKGFRIRCIFRDAPFARDIKQRRAVISEHAAPGMLVRLDVALDGK